MYIYVDIYRRRCHPRASASDILTQPYPPSADSTMKTPTLPVSLPSIHPKHITLAQKQQQQQRQEEEDDDDTAPVRLMNTGTTFPFNRCSNHMDQDQAQPQRQSPPRRQHEGQKTPEKPLAQRETATTVMMATGRFSHQEQLGHAQEDLRTCASSSSSSPSSLSFLSHHPAMPRLHPSPRTRQPPQQHIFHVVVNPHDETY
jgi:hypothetical protein